MWDPVNGILAWLLVPILVNAGMKAQVSEPPVDGQDQVRHLNLVPETVSAGVGALAGNEL